MVPSSGGAMHLYNQIVNLRGTSNDGLNATRSHLFSQHLSTTIWITNQWPQLFVKWCLVMLKNHLALAEECEFVNHEIILGTSWNNWIPKRLRSRTWSLQSAVKHGPMSSSKCGVVLVFDSPAEASGHAKNAAAWMGVASVLIAARPVETLEAHAQAEQCGKNLSYHDLKSQHHGPGSRAVGRLPVFVRVTGSSL